MKKVFMIHGYGGEPNGGWRPWLMGKLARQEIWACALDMPMIDKKPVKDEWVNTIRKSIGAPNEDTYLVGHSLGVPAILNYLETLSPELKIGGAVLVSGIIHPIEGEDKYKHINHFYDKNFNYENIKKVCSNFVVIHGDNDTSVPFTQALELSQNLSCKLITVKNGGHLNGSSGWYELPEALVALEEMCK